MEGGSQLEYPPGSGAGQTEGGGERVSIPRRPRIYGARQLPLECPRGSSAPPGCEQSSKGKSAAEKPETRST